jgi:hypothetical protein
MIILNLTLSKEDLFQFSYYTGWAAKWNIKKRINFYLKFIFYYVVAVALFFILRKKIHHGPSHRNELICTT